MEMKDVVNMVRELQERMDRKFGRESNVLFYFVDLMEEVGELAEVIRAREFYNTEPEEDLESELADIFYDLVGIAGRYGVDLEKAILNRLRELERRFLELKGPEA